jgi:hypothetical protein
VDWRSLVAGAAGSARSFHVHNPTPYNVRVRWSVFNYAHQPERGAAPHEAEPWLTAQLRVKHGRIRVALELLAYEATAAEEQQFRVEPAEVVVRAGQPAAFKVVFASAAPGVFCGFLRGEQMCMHDEGEPVSFKVWERLPRGYESSSDEGDSDAEEAAAAAAPARDGDGEDPGAASGSVGEGEGEEGNEGGGGEVDAAAYRTEELATVHLEGSLASTGKRRGQRRGPRAQPRYTLAQLAEADKCAAPPPLAAKRASNTGVAEASAHLDPSPSGCPPLPCKVLHSLTARHGRLEQTVSPIRSLSRACVFELRR